ncbi:hypothetical protein L0663_05285 [Dyadobacter sp. CY107]|uniref:hypothetical protein n=1 Tax=Dyadobacter fanqingshengii TaxID=2906443 RepID=UPI001F37CEDC|nr:hypothetical protein [Dyadobacter fanqingshengii]MCF2502780.1 hypothetical protein [Dyadobacter fanqingshengii]
MDANTIALYALYVSGAALLISLPLAWIQITQYLRERKNLEVRHRSIYVKTARVDRIIIEIMNLSSTPALVNSWNLAWGKSYGLWVRYNMIENDLAEGDSRLDLLPRIREEVEISEKVQEFFLNGVRPKGENIYMVFYLAGNETPRIILLHEPDGKSNRIYRYLFR